jgi:hypothetical protein
MLEDWKGAEAGETFGHIWAYCFPQGPNVTWETMCQKLSTRPPIDPI